jgi:superfamily II DNA or RNA helicase
MLSHHLAFYANNQHYYKIGSSKNLPSRMRNYQTYYPYPTSIVCYIFIEDYCAYQLDEDLKVYFDEFRSHIPGGGIEFYTITKEQLLAYLDSRNIKYTVYIDDDYKRHHTTQIEDAIEFTIEYMQQNKINISDLQSNKFKRAYDKSIQTLLNLITDVITLKQWQIEACQNVKLFLDDPTEKAGIIMAPTGCGKSYLIKVITIFCYILQKQKDVMIMNKRLEIFDQKFVNELNDIINYFNLKIKVIDMQKNNDYSNNDFINDSDYNHIYIINNDKFIASKRFNTYMEEGYSFGRLGLLILDECHWSGAKEFSKFLTHMKDNIVDKMIGFSATPVRTILDNYNNTLSIFKSADENNINILYNRSYIDSIIQGDRLPTKHIFIPIVTDGAEENEIDNEEKEIVYAIGEKGYRSFMEWFNNWINRSAYKKGILWFPSIKKLEEFDEYIRQNKEQFGNLHNITIIKSHSKNDMNGLEIEKFKSIHNNALLLVVDRGCEGFDDKYVDFGLDMYICKNPNPLKMQQKEGRVSRLCEGKEIGYYGCLVMSNDSKMKNKIAKRYANWIENALTDTSAIPSNGKYKNKTTVDDSDNVTIHLIDQILDDENIIELGYDELRDEIIREITNDCNIEVQQIKRHMKMVNKMKIRKGEQIIDTKILYDEYAALHNLPTNIKVDDNNWVKFLRFDYEDYIKNFYTRDELKQVCKNNNIRNYEMYREYCSQDPKCFKHDYLVSNVYGNLFNIDDYFVRISKRR